MQFDGRLGSKIDVSRPAGRWFGKWPQVRPRSQQQLLIAPGEFRPAVLLDALERVQRAL